MRRGGCWRLGWCWTATTAPTPLNNAAWIVKRCATGYIAVTNAVSLDCPAVFRLAPSPACHPRKRPRWRNGFVKVRRWPNMAWCAGAGSTCPGRSRSGLALTWLSAASATCCAVSASAACRHGRGIPAMMPRHRRRTKKFAGLVAEAIPSHAQGKPIELWWQDEARVGQQGTLTRLWARRGSRPPAPRDCRYDWAYIFGAVCPARGIGAALVLPHANIEAMTLRLAEISRRAASGAHAVVVVDGAGWHKIGGRLIVPDNISLLVLPPYSPELNPQENVWQCLRQNYLSNRVFNTYDAIVDACCDAWNSLLAMPDRITSIATRSWTKTVKV